jgi:cytochrome c oxidase cbb3-type subunit 3
MFERTFIIAAAPICVALTCAAAGLAAHTPPAQATPGQATAARAPRRPTPAQSKDAFVRACTQCHPPERVTATRRTKAQWEESINAMVTSRGAVVSADDYDLVLDYLVREFGPIAPRAAAASPRGTTTAQGSTARARAATGTPAQTAALTIGATPPQPPRPIGGGAGPNDKHIVDAAAATRGRSTYAAACIQCHGTQARGGERGANLVRSLVVLRDRYGNELGPFLRKGHPVQSGPPTTSYSEAQVKDLSHFLHERLNDTLRGSPIFTVQNVLTGNRQAGETWFNGAGGCRQCHSPTGDLAGIGSRYDPPTLQQRALFPLPPGRGLRGRPPAGKVQKPVTVRVTTASGETAEGPLVYMDDFNVSLRDAAGNHRSWARTPGLTVVKNDPYAAHIALLDVYTDANMHDIVAYLESLK